MARVVRSSSPVAKGRGSLSYILPLFAAIIILVLIVKAFFGSSGSGNPANSGDFVNVTPKSENSEIYVYMSGDSKKQISGETKLFTTDTKLEVKSGDADITLVGDTSKISADKLAELAYHGTVDTKKEFELASSYIWVEANSGNLSFKLKNFTANPESGAVFALYQNAVGSNLYVLKGSVAVATESSSTTVGLGQMVTVLSNEAKTAKLPEKITPIDDFFKTTDIFVKHNGGNYLTSSNASGSVTASGSLQSASGTTSSNANEKAILFTYPEDEMSVTTATIDIEGKIGSATTKVTLNDKAAEINKSEKSFSFKGFSLPSAENNIVYRAYDENGIIIAKGVLTVNSSAKKGESTENKPTVTSYPVSDKDFKITSPTENPYKTNEDVVRIQGQLAKGVVKYITINGYRLSKFSQYSSSWYYFANKDFGTLNEGINLYEIKYYGENDNLLSTGMFTIVKEVKKVEVESSGAISPAPSKTSSGSSSLDTSEKKDA